MISDAKKAELIAMSHWDYDKYMCATFPEMFEERKLGIAQSCMAWGFDIGPGWQPVLYELCLCLDKICKATNSKVIFTKVKEKYGGARFYNSTIAADDAMHDVIDAIVSHYEGKCDQVCAVTGEYISEKPVIGGWYYDCGVEGFRKIFAESTSRLEALAEWVKCNEARKEIDLLMFKHFDSEEYEQTLEHVQGMVKKLCVEEEPINKN